MNQKKKIAAYLATFSLLFTLIVIYHEIIIITLGFLGWIFYELYQSYKRFEFRKLQEVQQHLQQTEQYKEHIIDIFDNSIFKLIKELSKGESLYVKPNSIEDIYSLNADKAIFKADRIIFNVELAMNELPIINFSRNACFEFDDKSSKLKDKLQEQINETLLKTTPELYYYGKTSFNFVFNFHTMEDVKYTIKHNLTPLELNHIETSQGKYSLCFTFHLKNSEYFSKLR